MYLNWRCDLHDTIMRNISKLEDNDTELKRIFFLDESESRILFVIQNFFESESESYS